MIKVTCPRCGLMNLQQFVTFPHCARCGARLQDSVPEASAPVWRRPLGPLLWLSILGFAAIGLVGAATVFEAANSSNGQLLAYARATRHARVGATLQLDITLDSVHPEREFQILEQVSLRLPRSFFKQFRLDSLEPAAREITVSGKGRYFHFESLPRETKLHLRLSAKQPGTFRIESQLYARDHLPGEFRVTVVVGPRSAPTARKPPAR